MTIRSQQLITGRDLSPCHRHSLFEVIGYTAAVYEMSDVAYTAAVYATPDIAYTAAILYTNVAI